MAVSEDNKRVIITLPKDIYEQLKSKAEQEMRSVSNMGSMIIVKYLKEQE